MRRSTSVSLKNYVIGSVALMFFGCAQLSPQQIDFAPSIPTEGLIQSSGTASLTVVDARQDKIIGFRGGVYADTATISAKLPLETVIESLATQVLDKTGIELSNTFPDSDIQISIDELSYVSQSQKAGIKRSTAVAAISIQVKRGNVNFQNGYKTTQYIDTVGYPKEHKNDELLNNVFDAVLERMFSDQSLEVFLNQSL